MSYEVRYTLLEPSTLTVDASRPDDEQYQRRRVLYPQTRVLVDGLQERGDYEVKVAATTAWGTGVFSTPLDFFVGEAGKIGGAVRGGTARVDTNKQRIAFYPPPLLKNQRGVLKQGF